MRALNMIEWPAEGPEAGPPLVIAHGLFGQARNFSALSKRFAATRRVVAVDMRNHGDSPWGAASYPAMATDLAAVLRRVGPAVLLGHSMGGKAAMATALTDPGLLAGLIVADIAPVAYGHSHQGLIKAMAALDLSNISRRAEADAALAGAIPDGTTRAFLLQNLVIRAEEKRWKLNLDALAAGMDNLVGWPSDLAGKTYAGPALFVYGGASTYMDTSRRPAVEALFPQAQYHVIPKAGHWLHAERPDAFAEAVEAFLKTL